MYYFDNKNSNASLEITSVEPLILGIKNWNGKNIDWVQSVSELSSKLFTYVIHQLKPDVDYSVKISGKLIKKIKSDLNINLRISHIVSDARKRILIRNED